MSNEKKDVPEAHSKLKRDDYDRELARLHVESVKLQQWVVQTRGARQLQAGRLPLQDHSRSLLSCCGNADTWQSRRGERHE
jgi:hypothetical protein